MNKIFTAAFVAVSVCASVICEARTAHYDVVPLPKSITVNANQQPFELDSRTCIVYPKGDTVLETNARLLAEYMATLTGYNLKVTSKAPSKNAIVLQAGLSDSNPDAYVIEVEPKRITINGATPAANFIGIQTLRKAVPAGAQGNVVFPAVTIKDFPRFGYRGTHFDTARHFFPVDSIKKFIDMIALHNINRFHWHITDDQGWRLEIKKYPRLIEIGSKRKGTCVGHDFETLDGVSYGGYYTQDDVRELVKYAADRHITIIPEIDLPGHMVAALAAYPELGCTGGPYEVWTKWGVSDDLLCAGNDSTLTFIDDVLTEVADLFPSEYIHIGGDECPKFRWEECPKCQARIAELGLVSDEHSSKEQKLQSWVMEHAAGTLAKLGRKMIGWDEILEGGLFPGATVMSWRGSEGAVAAAQLGHDAILTPTNYCYFDYMQSRDASTEPLGIGGFVPVAKVYSLEPTAGLTPEQAKHILGAQSNLWTEYITTFPHVQYMELPRLAALSEVQWLSPEQKNYEEFTQRLPRLIDHYRALDYNFATHIFDIQGGLVSDFTKNKIVADLRTIDKAPIHYTIDGSVPTLESPLYTAPVVLDTNCRFNAKAFRPEGESRMFSDTVTYNKATSCAISFATTPHSRYTSTGSSLLTDGRFGGQAFNTGEWIGFEGTPMIATIDLNREVPVSNVTIRNLIDTPNWIFDAVDITVSVSTDGEHFTPVATLTPEQAGMNVQEIRTHSLDFESTPARYVKVEATCIDSIPSWDSRGVGCKGFIFIDEISVD
ncbi:MAG: family 20 glycosylhydrolase [Muribaculaceae bacterium]|nr:family 20 glycosylhydrolase [Muribaculaceae bacterium]